MAGIIDCCYKCVDDRYPGCHDHCKRYKEQREKHDKRKAELTKDRDVRDYWRNSQEKRHNRYIMDRKKSRGYYGGFHK